VLDDASWNGSVLNLGGVEFETEQRDFADWKHEQERFLLMKSRELIELYAKFWSGRETPRDVVELGIWEGGSSVFWFEVLAPNKFVAIDQLARTDSDRFTSYVESRGATDRLKTYWGVDQGDRAALGQIVKGEFGNAIDLVIDDASHLYEPTRVSFEVFFPRLRAGGLYIIEDWQWSLLEDFEMPAYAAGHEPVSRLVLELVERLGRAVEPIGNLTITQNFVAIEKAPGPRSADTGND
jgi:hypothetical protein